MTAIHEFIVMIGYYVVEFFRNINVATILQALEITVTGWLGIFVVTGVIILVVYLLNKIKA
jgi:hypothetical protein